MIELSICICTMPKRYPMLARLLRELYAQINELGAQDIVEILTDDTLEFSTGIKRRKMYESAKGKYTSSVDDDDTVSTYYVREILNAIKSDPDAVGMNGMMTWDNRKEQKWFIAKDNDYVALKRFDGQTVYSRYHNHLSPIRSEIVKQFPFADAYLGEDFDFAKRVHDSGLIKTEVCIGTVLKDWMGNKNLKMAILPMYHYRYITNKLV